MKTRVGWKALIVVLCVTSIIAISSAFSIPIIRDHRQPQIHKTWLFTAKLIDFKSVDCTPWHLLFFDNGKVFAYDEARMPRPVEVGETFQAWRDQKGHIYLIRGAEDWIE